MLLKQFFKGSERTAMLTVRRLDINKVKVAILDPLLERIMMLVQNGSFTRYIFHLSLDCMAFVSINVGVGALLVHPFVVVSLGILDNVFWLVLVRFKLFSHG